MQVQLRRNCASGYCSSLPSGQISQSEYSVGKDPLTDKEMKIIGDLWSHQLWPGTVKEQEACPIKSEVTLNV